MPRLGPKFRSNVRMQKRTSRSVAAFEHRSFVWTWHALALRPKSDQAHNMGDIKLSLAPSFMFANCNGENKIPQVTRFDSSRNIARKNLE